MDVDGAEAEYLNVRETARRLGVHENTVRNWARDGALPTSRIPGSRFHRFDARDVERLRQQRGAPVSSVERQRRTIGPELVDATQLSHWATTRDAQDTFPELMRRLLASAPGVTSVSVRAGEGVSTPGWDGRAESAGSAYLPRGQLCFEFGVGGQPKRKANEDYEKRRDDPGGVTSAETTFIFVTPRRWAGAAAWVTARRAEGVFADVRALDADDLEGWLQATPAVHHWISEHLGRKPRDAETLERWWDRFQARTDPPLPSALFLAGREREHEALTQFIEGPPDVLSVQAAWRDEAIAFLCATIETMEREDRNPVQPALVVSSAEVWDRIVLQPGRMTLLPLFDDPAIASAQEHGHWVVLPIGREQLVRGTKIELPRPHRRAASEALEAVGVDFDRAYHLGALARRSMPSLVRTLARDPRLARPPWSRLPVAGAFAPLMLAGAWTASEDDTAVVSRIAGLEWPDLERALNQWRITDDPPFVRAGTQWHLASAEEALLLLHESLTASDLERWRPIALEVLLETDPTLELAPENRQLAGLRGVSREHSSVLRRGIAEGIALLGSLGDEMLSDGVSGADHAHAVVREVLNHANADASGRTWRSVTDVLPLLAEAAPETFLDAVHEDLDKDEPLLSTMFQDADDSSWLYSSSPHTGLLWALEGLCWSPEYLLEASRALARLHEIDPGGRLANRPLSSLGSVLVGWIRHTAAPLELRVGAVEQICRQLPNIGWQLVLAVWPSHHATSSPPHSPRYRDWRPESRTVTIAEWVEYIGHLVSFAIGLAGTDAQRWGQLTEHLASLPPDARGRVLDAFDDFADPKSLDAKQRLLIWEALHKEIARHRQFATADWSMDDEPLSRMQVIADRLEPTASVGRFAYLFDWHPDLPDVEPFDHDAYEKKLLELRKLAVQEALEGSSLRALRDLADRSVAPTQLGWIVGAVASDEVASELLRWLDSENLKLREVATSWASRKMQDGDPASWLRDALARPEMTSTSRRTALALQAPPTREVWEALAELDPELNDAYWRSMSGWRVQSEDADYAARELLGRERPWVAVDLLALDAHRRKKGGTVAVTPSLVEEVLDAAMAADPKEARAQSLGYELGLLLDYLEAEGCDPEKLARYEFTYFHLLDHHREPRTLFALLRADPSLFVDLVQRIYRGKNEPRRQLNEHDQALAHHAWWVLNHWHDLPGHRADGTVDADHLNQWVRDARLALAETDRADIGDEQIGQVLAASPPSADGNWPAEAVRDIIETIGSTSVETGIHVGVVNARGITSRGVYDGGEQERELAQRYREWAQQTAGRWPRTSRVLRGLAESYERDARREDLRAAVTADTE